MRKKIFLILVIILITGCGKGNENKMNENKDIKKVNELVIIVNNRELYVDLEDNSSVDALLEKLSEGNVTINAHDFSNFEKVGFLGFDLPTNDEEITTTYGDIILYQGNEFVIYYDSNTWSFTKIGHIKDINQDELIEILGDEDVTIILEGR